MLLSKVQIRKAKYYGGVEKERVEKELVEKERVEKELVEKERCRKRAL